MNKKQTKEDKELKKVKKEIWWTETKIGWLNLVSGKTSGIGANTPMFLLPAIPLGLILIILLEHFTPNKYFKYSYIIIFFVLWYYFNSIIEKKAGKKLKLLNQKLDSLYKQKFNLTN